MFFEAEWGDSLGFSGFLIRLTIKIAEYKLFSLSLQRITHFTIKQIETNLILRYEEENQV
jgi:hypothetical protein